MSVRFTQVQKLAASHDVAAFDCGHPALNQFLQRFALVNQKANSAQTYVSCERGTDSVAGFYSLAVGSVEPSAATGRLAKGLARHPVPVMILARLAVDLRYQGAGLGRALLKDALLQAFGLFWFMPRMKPPVTGTVNGDSSQVLPIRIICFS